MRRKSSVSRTARARNEDGSRVVPLSDRFAAVLDLILRANKKRRAVGDAELDPATERNRLRRLRQGRKLGELSAMRHQLDEAARLEAHRTGRWPRSVPPGRAERELARVRAERRAKAAPPTPAPK